MKVDLAVNNHTGDKPIFRIAKASGVKLALLRIEIIKAG